MLPLYSLVNQSFTTVHDKIQLNICCDANWK